MDLKMGAGALRWARHGMAIDIDCKHMLLPLELMDV